MAEKRAVRIPGLIAALVIAPGLAGLVGGLLVFLSLIFVIFSGESVSGEAETLTAALFVTSLIAMLVGAVFSYVVGTPFILVAWAIGHFFTSRRAVFFAGLLAIAGTLFSQFLFGGFLDSARPGEPSPGLLLALIPILAGAIAGAGVGLVISALGYKNEPESAASSDCGTQE